MRNRFVRFAAVGLLAFMLIALAMTPAYAHEQRNVGKYSFVVGFGDEPAFTGQKNSVQLFLNDAKSGKAITDLGNTLNVQVSYGGQTMPEMTMEPDFEIGEFGTPGDYRAWFFPTRPGKYTFHFTGTVKGQKIDESFTSSPTGFGEAEDAQSVEFPVKDPTTGQLNDRISREFPRVDASISDASDSADSAKTLGLIGIVMGGLGLLIGIAGFMRGRRTA
ncbi:MAG: hypothetical protein QOF16_1259 [Actinomycetota bacterium]|nr:hypothetical protein [Actinomycetota bacterium]MEA2487605.1 hypothetical protein [Actinomycetota bacterium]